MHGSGDDNVHFQGTERLINALVAANRPFTLMVYPNRTHCICEGDGTTLHLYSPAHPLSRGARPAGRAVVARGPDRGETGRREPGVGSVGIFPGLFTRGVRMALVMAPHRFLYSALAAGLLLVRAPSPHRR